MYQEYYNWEPQSSSESNDQFISRIVSLLRNNNFIVEAHELQCGNRYENSNSNENVMIGIIGAVLNAKSNNSSFRQNVGDDYALGTLHRYGQEKNRK